MLRIETITTSEGLRALEPVWNPLLRESRSDVVTLTFEWLSTWWEVFNEDRELYILLARDGEAVIGIAPLLKRTVQHYGVLPFRRLEFLASGEDEADEICSEYLDFIVKQGREAEVMRAFFEFLREDEDWDEILLSDVMGESASLALLRTLCDAQGTAMQTVKEQTAIYLPLAGNFQQVLQNTSSSFRRKVKQDRRTFAANDGSVQIIKNTEAGLEAFEKGFATLKRLHQARWTSRGKPGVFASEKFTRFHRLLAPKALRRGWLRLYIAAQQGEAFAAIYNFIYNGRAYYYQSGLQVNAGKLISPGVLLQSFAIEDAIHSGLREYDFLKGEPGSYKSKWADQTRDIVQVRLAQSRTKEALYKTTNRVLDGLRSIKRSLTSTATS